MQPVTLAVLLSLMIVHSCTASHSAKSATGCTFDKLMKSSGPLPVAVVQEIPKKENGLLHAYTLATPKQWDPLRILVSMNAIDGPTQRCPSECSHRQDIAAFNDANGTKQCVDECIAREDLTEIYEKMTTDMLKNAIQLHTDRLFVHRAKGPFIVPQFTSNVCKQFTVPKEHRTAGVDSADMVLYVSMNYLPLSKNLPIWALPCAVNDEGRPVAAVMNFLSRGLGGTRSTVRLAAHHIAHALGFGYNEMKAKGMITAQTARSNETISVVMSDKVAKAAQWHYGCSGMKGMELEDEEKRDKKQHSMPAVSHWKRRNAKDELMAPITGFHVDFLGYYTELTMAAFADLGYYAANFSMAEPMKWGRGAGCSLIDTKCVEKGVSKHPQMFCTDGNERKMTCTSDRIGMGRCSVKNDLPKSLPESFQYFHSDKTGGDERHLTDYCPIIDSFSSCVSSDGGFPWSSLGENVWCLDGKSVKIKPKKEGNGEEEKEKQKEEKKEDQEDDEEDNQEDEQEENEETQEHNAACTAVSCDGGEVRVKYLGNEEWHECPEGQSITLQSGSYVSGTIMCPKYEEVCTVDADRGSLVATQPKKGVPSKNPFAEWTPHMPKGPAGGEATGAAENIPSGHGKHDGSVNPRESSELSPPLPEESVGETNGGTKNNRPGGGGDATGIHKGYEHDWWSADSAALRSALLAKPVVLLAVLVGEWLA